MTTVLQRARGTRSTRSQGKPVQPVTALFLGILLPSPAHNVPCPPARIVPPVQGSHACARGRRVSARKSRPYSKSIS
eukprot:1183727-Prorocentrum_minimum.AAC.1